MSLGPEHATDRFATTSDAFPWAEILDRSPIAMLLLDARADRRGRILHTNRAARDLLSLLRRPTGRSPNSTTSADGTPSTDGSVQAGPAPPHRHPSSIFDIIGRADEAALVQHFDRLDQSGRQNTDEDEEGERLPTEPIRLNAYTRSSGNRSEDRTEDENFLTTITVYLQPGPNQTTIAQVVPGDAGFAADAGLVQQQRFRSALMELSEQADSTSDDDEFYQRLIERAVEVVPGAQSGSVQLNIPGTASFRFVAASGFDLAGLQLRNLERDHFFRDTWDPAARIVRDFDIAGRSDETTQWLETWGRLSEIVVNVSAPVLVDGLPVAFLSLDNFDDPNAFTETSVEMTTVLSKLIGSLWRRRHLEAEIRNEREAFRHEALHDPLTALPNRRSLGRLMNEALETARREGRPSAVLFLDIDDFKGVNDRLGHEVGDLLLVGVANCLKDVVRLGDVVGRWGGDEFLVLPQRLENPMAVEGLAARILQRFEEELVLDSGLTYRARLTVGIGWSSDSTVTSNRLVATADSALYEAKAAGKGVARLHRI